MTTTKQAGVGPLKYAPGLTKTLVVQVTDPATKKGVPGASVEVWGLRGGYLVDGKPDPRRVNTGADGSITFKDLPVSPGEGGGAKEWIVKVNKEQFGPAKAPFRVGEVVVKPTPTGEAVCKVAVELTSPKVDVTVRVVDGKDEAKGVAGASVELWGLRGGWDPGTKKGKVETNAKGEVVWKGVSLVKADGTAHEKLHLKVNKRDWGYYSADRWVEGEVARAEEVGPAQTTVSVKIALFPRDDAMLARIERLKASQPGSAIGTNESRSSPSQQSVDAGTDERDLGRNPPLVCVCGSPPVLVEAAGEGGGYVPASWKVVPHASNAGATAPSCQAQGNHARIGTDQPGLFVVEATVQSQTRVLHLCFVRVELTPGAVTATSAFVRQGSVEGEGVDFKSGEFTREETPFAVRWSVRLSGGRQVDRDLVSVAPLQNCTKSDLMGHYARRITEGKVAATTLEQTVRLPILDTGMDSTPMCCTKSMFLLGATAASLAGNDSITMEQSGDTRHFLFLDAPTILFNKVHPHTGMHLERITGPMYFRVAICAFSRTSPGAVVALATCTWGVNFKGRVTPAVWDGFPGSSYTVADDGTTVFANPLTPCPPQDPLAMGMSVARPEYHQGSARTYVRRCEVPCPLDPP